MADYVSRETAIDAITQEPPEPHYPAYYGAVIQTVPAADVAPVRQWIPVTERQPKENECVLFWAPDSFEKCFTGYLIDLPRDNAALFNNYDGSEILVGTHWMPLPNPLSERREPNEK